MQKSYWSLPFEVDQIGETNHSPFTPGYAILVKTRIFDYFLHESDCFSIAFPQKGQSYVECKKGGNIVKSIAIPGFLSINEGHGQSSFRSPEYIESLNLPIPQNILISIAERESIANFQNLTLVDTLQCSHPETIRLARHFSEFIKSGKASSKLYAESIWTQIVLQLIWNFSSVSSKKDLRFGKLADSRMQLVIDFMHANLDQQISLNDLASIVNLSPNYFLNAFKNAMGKTPHRFFREIRIQEACELLGDPIMTIMGVAIRVGYTTQSHFTSSFRQVMGVTPAVYRLQKYGFSDK